MSGGMTGLGARQIWELVFHRALPDDESPVYYVIVCRECDPEMEMPLPFPTPEERGRWCLEHTQGSGHEDWLVVDQTIENAR